MHTNLHMLIAMLIVVLQVGLDIKDLGLEVELQVEVEEYLPPKQTQEQVVQQESMQPQDTV
jgi:hypothetical protein